MKDLEFSELINPISKEFDSLVRELAKKYGLKVSDPFSASGGIWIRPSKKWYNKKGVIILHAKLEEE